MQRTIDVIDPRSKKWTNRFWFTRDVYIAKLWGTRLGLWMARITCVPHPILQDMLHRAIIHHQQALAFRNQHDILGKVGRRHMNDWLPIGASAGCTRLGGRQ